MSNSSKVVLVRQLVEAARNNLDTATQLLKDLGADDVNVKSTAKSHAAGSVQRTSEGAVIIEGVFDGQNMVGPDGKLYSVPANYASKSKLVEGDLLKLTISPDGSFIYKQIGPVERERVVGVLARDEQTDEFRILARSHFFRVLLASVTYFKAQLGDEVVVLVPKGTPSTWAAVENVIKKDGSSPSAHETAIFEAVPEATEVAGAPAGAESEPVRRPRGRPRKVQPVAVTPISRPLESEAPAHPPADIIEI